MNKQMPCFPATIKLLNEYMTQDEKLEQLKDKDLVNEKV